MRRRTVRAPGGGCRPHGGRSLRGGACAAWTAESCPPPRRVDLERVGGWVVVGLYGGRSAGVAQAVVGRSELLRRWHVGSQERVAYASALRWGRRRPRAAITSLRGRVVGFVVHSHGGRNAGVAQAVVGPVRASPALALRLAGEGGTAVRRSLRSRSASWSVAVAPASRSDR
jgi:hypothetical protein